METYAVAVFVAAVLAVTILFVAVLAWSVDSPQARERKARRAARTAERRARKALAAERELRQCSLCGVPRQRRELFKGETGLYCPQCWDRVQAQVAPKEVRCDICGAIGVRLQRLGESNRRLCFECFSAHVPPRTVSTVRVAGSDAAGEVQGRPVVPTPPREPTDGEKFLRRLAKEGIRLPEPKYGQDREKDRYDIAKEG